MAPIRVNTSLKTIFAQLTHNAKSDLGTTPLELLQPDVFACPNVKRMGVVIGKSGKMYILNLDNLGGYQQGCSPPGSTE